MKRGYLGILVLGLALLFGCKDSSRSKVAKKPLAPAISAADQASATAFGEELERRLLEGDTDLFIESTDLAEMFFGSFEGEEIPADFKRGVKIGLKGAEEGMAANLSRAQLDFVGYEEVRGYPGMLFRVRADGGLDYIRYQLNKSATHSSGWKIVDAYPFSLGTFGSDMLRAIILPSLKQDNRNLFEKVLGGKGQAENFEHAVEVMGVFQMAQQEGQEKQALEAYEGLAEKAKTLRLGRLMRIFVSSSFLDDPAMLEEYQKALEAFQKHHPKDPSLSLLLIDAHVLKGDFDAVYDAISTLQESIPDNYLEFYKGFIDLHVEDYEMAEKRARDFMESDPDDIEGYELLLEAGFGKQDHEITAQALTTLESDFAMDYSGVFELAEWEDFRASEEGKKWAEERPEQ